MRFLISLALLLLLPGMGQAQYWGNRTTEQSFETSSVHFNSHFLNTHGLFRFKDVAPGLFDDPFLEIHLNPANRPQVDAGDALFYFDFRGDRTEAELISYYHSRPYYDIGWYPHPVWYSQARTEPEPIFSFGLLTYPFRERLRKMYVGATYQVIYKEEPYYTMPVWIYSPYDRYDPFGDEIDKGEFGEIPVQDRYYGRDELSTEAHLLNFYLGFPVTRDLDVGASLSSVTHDRDGAYINSRTDEYGQTDRGDYRYYNERIKNQEYDHIDVSAGVRYEVERETYVGAKLGYLSGDADQDFHTVDSSLYARGDSLIDQNWYHNRSRGRTDQEWTRDGDAWYARLSFERDLRRGKHLAGYYRYKSADLDLSNATAIFDTAYGASEHYSSYNDRAYRYHHTSYVRDTRTGTGSRSDDNHEAMVTLRWKLNRTSRVSIGALFSSTSSKIDTEEPAFAVRFSEYFNWYNDTLNYHRLHHLVEDKRVEWHHETDYRTIQIPVLVHLDLDRHFTLTLGVNQILERWEVTNETIEFFTYREDTRDDGTEYEENFAERYVQPTRKYTEDYTAVLADLQVLLSEQFKISLKLDPETEGEFKINQWWLSFRLGL